MANLKQKNQAQPKRSDFWDGIERIAKLLQIVVIPVVLAIGGWGIQSLLAKRSENQENLKAALKILEVKDPEVPYRWALAMVEQNSSIKFSLNPKLKKPQMKASPDNTMRAIVYPDGTAEVWNHLADKLLLKLPGDQYSVTALDFAPDTALLVTVCQNKTARLWNLRSGLEICGTPDQTDILKNVGFPDGKHFFTVLYDGTIENWSIDCRKLNQW